MRELKERGLKSKYLLFAKKHFKRVKFWKINLFNIFKSLHYDAVLSYEDLIGYYESELFAFYQDHPNMLKPNLVHLL